MINAEKPLDPLGVVLVNWNRWADTIEALESLLRSTMPLRVVVVDNASADGSLDRIAAWAAGEQMAVPASAGMARFCTPPLPKPIRVRRLGPDQLASAMSMPEDGLTLVDSGGNLGYAGGNNVGLRLLMTDPAIRWFWLLNNDTVVEADAAAAIVARMTSTENIGMCGAIVRYYWRPDHVQALNGYRFRFRTGSARPINGGQLASVPFDVRAVVQATDFIIGASLAVSREFLEAIGLMEESYFLYYEEIDWAVRNNGRFAIAFADAATVYHKEGGSIGSSGVPGARSGFADYWLARSRLAFIRRHRPLLLPLHWFLTLGLVGRRLVRRQPEKAWTILRALFGN